MKTYCGIGGIVTRILNFSTRWGKWSDSSPGRFTSWVRERGWVGSQSERGGEDRRSPIIAPRQKIEPRSSNPQLSLHWLIYPGSSGQKQYELPLISISLLFILLSGDSSGTFNMTYP